MTAVYIAVAQYPPTDTLLPCIKVGISDNLGGRQIALNGTKMPFVVKVQKFIAELPEGDARTIENAVHKLLQRERIDGSEWFHFEDPKAAVKRVHEALKLLATLCDTKDYKPEPDPYVYVDDATQRVVDACKAIDTQEEVA